jgi:two-component system, LytTR family, response regulator LytT
MKVLVVAEENQVVKKLEQALKNIDNSIRIIGTVNLVYRTRFLVRQGQKFASVETGEIAYFFSEGRFIFFKTFDNQKYLVEYTLEELEEMLNPQNFFRINRSLVVSFKGVEQIHPYFGNRLKLYLQPSAEKDIIVSREKVQDFKNWLGQ